MTELRRLLDGDGDELERALLDSAIVDEPSERATRRALVAIGVAGVAAGATAAATAQAAVAVAGQGAAGGLGLGEAAASKLALGVLLKWIGITSVGAFATLTAADHVAREYRVVDPVVADVEPAVQQAQERYREASSRPAPAARSDEAEAQVSAPPLADQGAGASDAAGGSGAGAARKMEPQAGLAAEVASLDQARAAMQAGDPNEALRALARYERDFAAGSLGLEAEVLRIEALARSGQSRAAQARADAFLSRYPHSAHAQRVRSLVASPNGAQ